MCSSTPNSEFSLFDSIPKNVKTKKEELDNKGFVAMSLEEKARLRETDDAIKLTKSAIKLFIKNIKDYDFEELQAVANVSYCQALAKFDNSKGFKFSTFFYQIARNDLTNFVKLKNIEYKRYKEHISLQNTIDYNDGDSESYENVIYNDNPADNLLENVIAKNVNDEIQKSLSILNKNEHYVITNRFEMFTTNLMTRKEVALKLNTSQADISKIQKNALIKIKNFLIDKGLEMEDILDLFKLDKRYVKS